MQEEGLIVRGGAGPQFRLHTLVNEQLVVGAMLCVCVCVCFQGNDSETVHYLLLFSVWPEVTAH